MDNSETRETLVTRHRTKSNKKEHNTEHWKEQNGSHQKTGQNSCGSVG